MTTEVISPAPLSAIVTMPPPEVPEALVSAIFAWASCSFCCMAWACFMRALRSVMGRR